MPTIDFASLTLQDALDLAILIEEEAKERYEEFADNLSLHHTPEAAHFFTTMAGNEAKHGSELRARRQMLFGDAPTRVTRDMLWDVEAPDFDQPRMFMTARQAMDAAMAMFIFARAIAEELKIEYQEVGRTANELGIKIISCELGCF